MSGEAPFDTGGHVRRCRRAAGLSQRAMARRAGVAQSVIARVETGRQDLRAQDLAALARAAGLRLALVDDDGAAVPPMQPDPVRDGSGRRFPAHVDVRHGDEDWWHGEERYSRDRPMYTFSLGREARDDDHRRPDPHDDLAWRRRERQRVSRDRRREEFERRVATGEVVPETYDLLAMCECPPGCEELLVGDDPEGQLDPHVADCPCRCDVH